MLLHHEKFHALNKDLSMLLPYIEAPNVYKV